MGAGQERERALPPGSRQLGWGTRGLGGCRSEGSESPWVPAQNVCVCVGLRPELGGSKIGDEDCGGPLLLLDSLGDPAHLCSLWALGATQDSAVPTWTTLTSVGVLAGLGQPMGWVREGGGCPTLSHPRGQALPPAQAGPWVSCPLVSGPLVLPL